MIRLRAVALVLAIASAGAAATLLAGRLVGMREGQLVHLAIFLAPAAVATAVAVAVGPRLLAGVPIQLRLVSLALVAVVVSLANLGVLTELAEVVHQTSRVAVLLVYSTGAGVAASLVVARSFSRGMGQLMEAATGLAGGDLTTRAGSVEGGVELQSLASTLDAMASRLQWATEREEQAVRARRDVVTAVSHDLRTPLSALRAMVEAVDDGVVADPETLRRYAGLMRRAVDSLVLLVDDLFELTQIDAGILEAEPRRSRLGEVVHAALAACEGGARAKKIDLAAHLDGVDAALCSPRLSRVVQNLVQNAIRHTPEAGRVRIAAERAEDTLRLVVEDNGEGIPEDQLDNVFEPFWRGDAARSTDGSGLGLALAKRIVEGLGGTIGVESRVGAGSRFAVVLPDGRGAGQGPPP